MARAFASLFFFVALMALALSALQFWDVTRSAPQDLLAMADAEQEKSTEASVETSTVDVPEEAASPFLPIFGVPEQPVPDRTSPAIAPAPATFDYTLKGVVASGQMRWAIFSGASGDLLVREGDLIDEDWEVAEIHAEGVDVALGDEVRRMSFRTTEPVEVVAFEAQATLPVLGDGVRMLPRPNTQRVLYQDLSPEEILAMLQNAERQRTERGWVTEETD